MSIDNKIRDEKLQYNINKEVAKISPLLSGKIDIYIYIYIYIYEFFTSKEIMPSDQSRIIEPAKEKNK